MPTYRFKNQKTEEVTEVTMRISELDQFREDNPDLETVISAPNIVSGSGGMKNDSGWKENMSRIAEAHPNSPMAQTYGTSRNHKEIKTYNAITKHAKSIGKSHDLNAISQEYKQGQLVK